MPTTRNWDVSNCFTSLLCRFFETTLNIAILLIIQSTHNTFLAAYSYPHLIIFYCSLFYCSYAKVIFLQYWLGAKRECAPWPQTSPFLWLDKSPMTFKHWQTSELNSGSLYCTIVYNYVKNHMWDSTACSLWYYTVCQFRLLSRK